MRLDTPHGGHPELKGYEGFAPDGYALAQRIRRDWPRVPVFGLTQMMDDISPSCHDWFRQNGDPSGTIGVYDKSRQWVLLRHHLLKLTGQAPPVKVFIVHGHDDDTKEELRQYVTGNLGWEAKILGEVERQNGTWIELFEREARQASLAWVLLTPDEWGCPLRPDLNPGRRPRPNVLLECGYFLGAFGRFSRRVLLFRKGNVELPSDLDGIARGVQIQNSVADADDDIRRELGPWL